MAMSSANPSTAHTRLHIAPFSPELFHLVVPTALRSSARNISYHTVETRPDQPYGFLDLPTADAERIRKKLNGAVLKGSKVRVELAREIKMPKPPGKEALADPASDSKDKTPRKQKDKSKKRKRDDVVIPAVQLAEGRKVKRGWTEPANTEDTEQKSAKKRNKDKSEKKDKKEKKAAKKVNSQYTDGAECLVKTVIPPGKPMPKLSGKDKKKKKGHEREVIVHEFENTKGFPSFLKSAQPATTSGASEAEYVNGVGWVDQNRNVVQPLRSSRPVPTKNEEKQPENPAPAPVVDDDSETSSSGSSSSEDEDENEDEEESAEASPEPARQKPASLSTSATQPDIPSETSATLESPRPKSSGSARNLSIKIPPPTTPAANKVHPLEALYKRNKTDATPGQGTSSTAKPFSFFGDSIEEGTPGNGALAQPPMTPFTQEDFEWRHVRSAAPTPDTAHPNKTFKLWPRDDAEDDIAEEDEEDEELGEQDAGISATAAMDVGGQGNDEQGDDAATRDFQSWFWEHRGDLNRSWKRRRKLAAKGKRYRENKARAERSI